MGIWFVRKCGIFDSINNIFLEPGHLGIDPKKVKAYIKKHPMPKDDCYSEEDLLMDLKSTSSWTLPDGIKDDTGNWIAELMDTFFKEGL